MVAQFRDVTKTEFDEWLASYPRKLVRNVTTICDPPNVNFNDFERAPYWPDSVVASYMAGDVSRGHRVIVDINSPVEDDGFRDTATPLADMNGAPISEGDRVTVHWGGGCEAGGEWYETWRDDTVLIRDKGTKYEHWSLTSCHNYLRSLDFKLLEPRP